MTDSRTGSAATASRIDEPAPTRAVHAADLLVVWFFEMRYNLSRVEPGRIPGGGVSWQMSTF
jgi:hypothetical protein